MLIQELSLRLWSLNHPHYWSWLSGIWFSCSYLIFGIKFYFNSEFFEFEKFSSQTIKIGEKIIFILCNICQDLCVSDVSIGLAQIYFFYFFFNSAWLYGINWLLVSRIHKIKFPWIKDWSSIDKLIGNKSDKT